MDKSIHEVNGLKKEVAYWKHLIWEEQAALGHVMKNIFGFYAAGIDFRAKATNGRPLVEYAAANAIGETDMQEDVHYILSLVNELIKFLITKGIDEGDLDVLQEIIGQKGAIISATQLHTLYKIILKYWETGLNRWSFTYRLLSVIAENQEWKDDRNTRECLCEITESLVEGENEV